MSAKIQRRVLVVEDDPSLVHQIEQYLQNQGLRVTRVSTGAEALRHLQQVPPDLLLADTVLPDMSGRDLVKKARAIAKGKRCPAILMSSVFTSLRQSAKPQGAEVAAFLPKPLRVKDLLRAVGHALGDSDDPAAAKAATDPDTNIEALDLPLCPRTVAEQLLQLCQRSRSGLLTVRNQNNEITITLLRGVPVNARSNLRQHTLGAYLVGIGRLVPDQVRQIDQVMRKKRLRFGEAMAELGLATAAETVGFLRGAILARMSSVVTWTQGKLHFEPDLARAEASALCEIDPREAILIGFAHYPNLREPVTAFGDKRDYFARYDAPRGGLCRVVDRIVANTGLLGAMAGTPTLEQLLNAAKPHGATGVNILYALWVAGLIRLSEDPPQPSTSPVGENVELVASRGVVSETPSSGTQIDTIFNIYLRCQGANYYTVLEVERNADAARITEAAQALRAQLPDPAQVASVPARARLEEVRAWIDTAARVLADTTQRQDYDRSLDGWQESCPDALANEEAEAAYRAGREALEAGNLDAALEQLRRAIELCPDDPDYAATLGLAEVRCANKAAAQGYERVVTACALNPGAARAHLYLGALCEERGEIDNAVDAYKKALHANAQLNEAKEALERLVQDEASELYCQLFADTPFA